MADISLKQFRSYRRIGTKAICYLEKRDCSSKSRLGKGVGIALRHQYGIPARSEAIFSSKRLRLTHLSEVQKISAAMGE